MNIAPDSSYSLTDGGFFLTPFDFGQTDRQIPFEIEFSAALDEDVPEVVVQLLSDEGGAAAADSSLQSCPRFTYSIGTQHKYIRLDEQSLGENGLRKGRVLWMGASWGADEVGFLGTVLERFRTDVSQPDAFHLKCDEAVDNDAFEALFPQQFGMSMQTFCHLLAAKEDAFLILDGIHPEIAHGKFLEFLRVVSAILDYCPGLRVVAISRVLPLGDEVASVSIGALDIPDTRTYIVHHPDYRSSFKDSETIEKIHERSEGLPMHLDRILAALKVTSLSSVLSNEMEGHPSMAGDDYPQALANAVAALSSSEDRSSRRSLRLLKVLSVLPYGEALDSVSHFLPAEPFFWENALQLKELTLLDVIQLQATSIQLPSPRSRAGEVESPKLLKVPRQVRDYVQSLLTEEERLDIVLAGTEKFFGRKWREGKVKIRTLPLEYREYLSSGAGNEFAVIHHILAHARMHGDETMGKRGAKLGVYYSNELKSADRYRDLAIVAGSLLSLLDRDSEPQEWSRLAALYGEGLRMTGKAVEALPYLRDALECGEDELSKKERGSIWLEIALAEESSENSDSALFAAEEVMKCYAEDSASYLHAESIVAEITLEGEDKIRRLQEIESRARDKKFATLADTIALNLAWEAKGEASEIQLIDRVIKSSQRGYNYSRAIVAKAKAMSRRGETGAFVQSDLVALSSAYSYLHAQRFGSLFDQCHEQLWNLFEARSASEQLLRLFRHTSFIWRIRGEESKETKYLSRLKEKFPESSTQATGVVYEIQYFLKRLKILIVGK